MVADFKADSRFMIPHTLSPTLSFLQPGPHARTTPA